MIEFIDRVQTTPKRIKLTAVSGTSDTFDYERVGNVTTEGTIINRAAMLSIQGFEPSTITVNADGSITETNSKGQTLKTSISDNGEVTEVFSGTKTVTKTTKCSNGNLVEVMS